MRPSRERRHTVTPVTPLRLVSATTVAVTVPCALFPLVGPWTLLWIPLVLAFLGVLLSRTEDVAGAADDTAGRVREDPAGCAACSPEAATGTRVRPVALPSAADDYDLVFSAVVHWRWEGRVDLHLRDPGAPAVLAAVTRAAELARGLRPGDHGLAERELAALLARETPVPEAGIVVWAEEVALRPTEEDAERLGRMARLRKDRALREAEEELAELEEMAELEAGRRGPALPPRQVVEGAAEEPARVEEADPALAPGPGSDVDGEGYESYWWPAQTSGHDAAERDVQVAILRGLIDSLEEGRADFARAQVEVLERGGFTEVARRVRAQYPELNGARGAGEPPSGAPDVS